jgi:hypothetical protein
LLCFFIERSVASLLGGAGGGAFNENETNKTRRFYGCEDQCAVGSKALPRFIIMDNTAN